MATINEISPDVWQVYARIRGERKRFRFSAYNCGGNDPEAAARKCYSELRQLEELTAGRRRRILISEFIDEYLRHCSITNAPATVRSDRGRLRIFAEWCAGDAVKYIDEITVAVFDRFKLHYHEVRKGSNANNYVVAVQALLSHAVRHELLDRNPLARYRKKPRIIDETAYFDLDEIAALLDAAEAPYPKYFIMFILNLGLRLSELKSLMWDDVIVPARPKKKDGRVYYGHVRIVSRAGNRTKSGKTRVIPVTEKLYPVIADLAARGKYVYVFDNGKGQPLYRSNKWHLTRFKRLAEEAGVELTRPGQSRPRTLKTLRDSFATWLINQGVPMYTVSKLLGHSSIGVTEQHYVHLIPGSLDAVDKLPF